MSEPNWYYSIGGRQVGPVPRSEVQRAAQAMTLSPTDLVWAEGMADWVPAGSVQDFFPAGAANLPGHPAQMINYYTPNRGPVYASFWIRFCAVFLDGIITAVVGAIVGGTMGAMIGGVMGAQGSSLSAINDVVEVVARILGLVVGWLYEALMTSSSTQGTLGKMAVGIKVTDLSSERISFGRATGRHFAKFVSVLILLIGYLMQPFTERRQALHDLMAGTLVLKKT